MASPLDAVDALASELTGVGWVTDLLVGGSLASGDHVPGVSDLDLVAIADGLVDHRRQDELVALHRDLDAGVARGSDLGCVYVDIGALLDADALHPTWTHGLMTRRVLSGISRAELVRYGYAVFGRAPKAMLPPMSDEDVRHAACAELLGYWARAARHPFWWFDRAYADLGLTSMARGRHALTSGELLTKTAAIERADAPAWLIDQMRARRRGERVASPRVRTALIAWRDARRTVALANAGAQ